MTHASDYTKTEQRWNNASLASRKRMLKAAGHRTNSFFARCFGFIPKHVQDDLIHIYQCSNASVSAFTKHHHQPIAA